MAEHVNHVGLERGRAEGWSHVVGRLAFQSSTAATNTTRRGAGGRRERCKFDMTSLKVVFVKATA